MKTSNTQSIKIENIKLVVEKLIELRETSRIELSKITSLNKATVSTIMQELVDKELVVETDKIVKTSGRSAKVFALNKKRWKNHKYRITYRFYLWCHYQFIRRYCF